MNWFRKSKETIQSVPELTTSILYNEATFYNRFVKNTAMSLLLLFLDSITGEL